MISRVQVIPYIIYLNMVKCFHYFDNQMKDHMPSSTYHPTLSEVCRFVCLVTLRILYMDITIMEEVLLN